MAAKGGVILLTEKQYRALCKYRDSIVPASGKPDDTTLDFLARGFIRAKMVEYTKEYECTAFYQKAFWELTTLGKLALEEFEEYVEQERNNQAKEDTNREIQRLQATEDRRKQFNRDVVIAIIGSAVGGLIVLAVQNWNAIVGFLTNLLQNLSPP